MKFTTYDIDGNFIEIENGDQSNDFVKGTKDITQHLIIPKFINMKEVKEINTHAFYSCQNILSIEIEARLTLLDH